MAHTIILLILGSNLNFGLAGTSLGIFPSFSYSTVLVHLATIQSISSRRCLTLSSNLFPAALDFLPLSDLSGLITFFFILSLSVFPHQFKLIFIAFSVAFIFNCYSKWGLSCPYK